MKKREIYDLDFVIGKVVALLDLILRGNFQMANGTGLDIEIIGRKEKIFFPRGKKSILYFESYGNSVSAKVRPRWWPTTSELLCVFSQQSYGWVPGRICLDMPINRIKRLELVLIPKHQPPFFDVDPILSPQSAILFENLCKKVYSSIVS